MKKLVLVIFIFSQGLSASEKIDFNSQIKDNLTSKKSLEVTYKTSLEKVSIENQEQQLADYIKHELDYKAPEALAEGDSKEDGNLKQ